MRVTATAKAETRRRILEAAADLFAREGFEATTTRRLAEAAGIATGTLFNYFPTKEALGMELVRAAADEARAAATARPWAADEEPDESLFELVVAELRRLEPLRPFLGEVLDTAMSPIADAASADGSAAASFRTGHLEAVHATLARHGIRNAGSTINAQLYWSLYLGLLAFWLRDDSPHQADTLALLARSLGLFARGLRDAGGGAGV